MKNTDYRPITPISILAHKIGQLQKSIANETVSDGLKHLIQECAELVHPMDTYISEHTTKPSQALVDLEASTKALDWDAAYNEGDTNIRLEKEMLSGAVEGQFLKMLVAISSAQNVLEIGSFTGYASLAMAEALPKDGSLIALEYDRFVSEFAKKHLKKAPDGEKVSVLRGDALNSIRVLKENNKVFDLIFIDADKQNYQIYYDAILDDGLLELGGLICVDNTLFMGQVYGAKPQSENGDAIADFNSVVAQDSRVEQVLLPLRDGLTLIRRIA